MKIDEITSKEYSTIFKNTYSAFLSVPFNELNKSKSERLIYLIFFEGRVKIGLIAGIKEGKLLSPFSAPYGGFSTYNDRIKLKYIDDSIRLLNEYVRLNQIKQIELTLPPYFYNESFLSKVYFSLIYNGYCPKYTDINFHFNATDFINYQKYIIGKRTKEKLKKTFTDGFIFKQVLTENDKLIAYNIIKNNREVKGRPLYLTFEQLIDTCKVIDIDFFLAYQENIPMASAIVYLVGHKIVQLIFWGDSQEYSLRRPMNFLTYKLFEFYANHGIQIIDLGISTENGLPNYGLCDFKQNIGGTASLKYTLIKNINK